MVREPQKYIERMVHCGWTNSHLIVSNSPTKRSLIIIPIVTGFIYIFLLNLPHNFLRYLCYPHFIGEEVEA